MNARFWLWGCVTLSIAACGDVQGTNSRPTDGLIKEAPEGVRAIAAPNQNLNAVRIDPTDGCYVYRYAGPVETTFLPLRTIDGHPICTKTAGVPVTS